MILDIEKLRTENNFLIHKIQELEKQIWNNPTLITDDDLEYLNNIDDLNNQNISLLNIIQKLEKELESSKIPLIRPDDLIQLAKKGHLTNNILNKYLYSGYNNINYSNDIGWTALLYACKNGHYKTVKLLLEKGADANHQDMSGMTALILVCRYEHYEIVHLLIEKGADVNLQTNWGLTALTCANSNNYYKISELLIRNGADNNKRHYGKYNSQIVWYI